MILRFLRLFAAFRSLEQDRDATVSELRTAVQESTMQNLLLQDRLDSMASDRAKLWEMMETAIQNERSTLQMQVNFAVQQKHGLTPFPEAVHLPESQQPSPEDAAPFARRLMPSELIARRTTQFMKEHQRRRDAGSTASQ